MDSTIITKIFPSNTEHTMLKYDIEGLWSITLPSEAEIISNIIKKEVGEDAVIFDGTAGIGGNTISFAKNFKYVTSVELSLDRFNLLKNNINIFNLQNINLINDNCINYLDGNYNVYFFDPPWGGPEYKYNNKVSIKLGNLNLVEIFNKIKIFTNYKFVPIFIKLPNNYDLEEFSSYNYKINKIKNYQLITIY